MVFMANSYRVGSARQQRAQDSEQASLINCLHSGFAGLTLVYRAAQRAFRERKQSQLAELQARIKQYEQGEIERNVTLQTISKRLKEENEQLRRENTILKERISLCETEHLTDSGENVLRKRRRGNHSSVSPEAEEPATKRAKGTDHPAPSSLATSYASYPSPASMASPPDSSDSPVSGFSSNPLPSEYPSSHFAPAGPDVVDSMDRLSQDTENRFPPSSCGLCSDSTDCFCRNMMSEVANEPLLTVPLRMEHFERKKSDTSIVKGPEIESPSFNSILEKLPPYQPAVPLRRRTAASVAKPIFELSAAGAGSSTLTSGPPTCSGDPDNCMACADDTFGQAFCAAVGESASTAECENCPCRDSDAPGHSPSQPRNNNQGRSDTIPTDHAWRQLKLHPNVGFADLTLLADVVARRSKCTGPRVVISPALGAATPDRADSPPGVPTPPPRQELLNTMMRNVRDRAPGSPPRLVPQEVLIECGRRRVREVRADAVKEALHMLDARNRFV